MAELKDILQLHPRYKSDANNVVNKFGYQERSSRGIIINSTSAERVRLSADNYVGTMSSFVAMSPYKNSPATSVEWVNENYVELEKYSASRNIFPTPPGYFLIEIVSLPNEGLSTPGIFKLKKYVKVEEPEIITFNDSRNFLANLSHTNIYKNSVQLYFDKRIRLIPDVDFQVDYKTSEVTFLKETPFGYSVGAKYVYGDKLDTFHEFSMDNYYTNIIPGVTIYFGDRVQENDKILIHVYPERTPVCHAYGGKFEVTFDCLVYSKDASDRESLVDYVTVAILERQMRLIDKGMELMEVGPGSDAEEAFNPETDEYYYEQSISVQLRVDWMVQIPLLLENVDIEFTSKKQDMEKGHLDGSYTYDLLNVEVGVTPGMTGLVGKPLGRVSMV